MEELIDDLFASDPLPSASVINVEKRIEPQWCDTCRIFAQEEDKRHKTKADLIKKKILFTDNLLNMYTQMKASLEESKSRIEILEQECKRKETDNQLVKKQLKAVLADKNPSELQLQKQETASLKETIEELNDKLRSKDMTKKMLEDKIESLKEEVLLKEGDWKKHLKEKDIMVKETMKLKKTIQALERENLSLNKKNEILQERLRKGRFRGSGSFSQTTDSEHNITANSEDSAKCDEDNDSLKKKAVFKSPSLDKKKRKKKRRSKSELTDASEDDETVQTVKSRKKSAEKLERTLSSDHNNENLTAEDKIDQNGLLQKEIIENNNASLSSDNAHSNDISSKKTNAMKARILEMKKKRALKSFSRRPNEGQMRDLSAIVDTLQEGTRPTDIQNNIVKFCQKNYLINQEILVVRKIIKLFHEKIDNKMTGFLQRLSFTSDNATPESEIFPTVTSDVADIPTSVSKCAAPDNDNGNIKHSSQPVLNDVTETPIKKPDDLPIVSVSILRLDSIESAVTTDENEKRIHNLTQPSVETYESICSNKVTSSVQPSSMFSSDDDDEPICVKIHSVNDHPKPADAMECDTSTTKPIESQPVETGTQLANEPQYDKIFSISSLTRTEVTVSASSDINNSKVTESTENKLLQGEMKSNNQSVSDASVTSTNMIKSAISETELLVTSKKKILPSIEETFLIQNIKKSSSAEKCNDEPHLKLSSGNVALDNLEVSVSKTTEVLKSVAASDYSSAETNYSGLGKRKRIAHSARGTKKQKSSSQTVQNKSKQRQSKNKSKEQSTPATANEETPMDANSASKTSSSLASLTLQRHPVLASMRSLPFEVGHESPNLPSANLEKNFSFFPNNQTNPEITPDHDTSSDDDNVTDSTFSKFLERSNLNNIFSDMSFGFITKPLSPLHNSDEEDSSEQPVTDKNEKSVYPEEENPCIEADEDSRPSISPSANLCTAFNFFPDSSANSEAATNKIQKLASVKKPETSTVSSVTSEKLLVYSNRRNFDNVRDTPRRFSCEAPVLARPVPSIKPVCKAQSLDPSLLDKESVSGGDTGSLTPIGASLSTDPSNSSQLPSVNKPIPPAITSPQLPCSLNLLTHTSSGPFKLVASNLTPPANLNTAKSSVGVNDKDSREKLVSHFDFTEVALSATSNQPFKNKAPAESADSAVNENVVGEKSTENPENDPVPQPTSNKSETNTSNNIKSTAENEGDVSNNIGSRKLSRPNIVPDVHSSASSSLKNESMNKLHKQQPKPVPHDRSSHIVSQIKLNVSLPEILHAIQSYAVVTYPEKTYSNIPYEKVLFWISNVIHRAVDYKLDIVLKSHLASNKNIANLDSQSVIHEWEYQFVKMISSVDKIRSEYGFGITSSLIIPTVMKTFCRYGNSLHTCRNAFKEMPVATLFNILSPLLQRDKLELGHTFSLARIFSTLCRSVGNARGPIDLCRYAFLAKGDSDFVIFNCIASYPAAFSKHFPLSGKIIVHKMVFSGKESALLRNERGKTNKRTLVLLLDRIMGWEGTENSCSIADEANPILWRKVFAQCMSNIQSAKLINAEDLSSVGGSSSESDVVRLSVENMDDVFMALEFMSHWKGLMFVTVEIVDQNFWPWLNAWSQHLVLTSNSDENKPVSDACMMAVLQGLSTVLSSLITKQQIRHPNQTILNQAVSYFKTICALLSNFTTLYINSVPSYVQCAAVVSVLTLSACDPYFAYTTVCDWLVASRTAKPSTNSTPQTLQSKNDKKNKEKHRLLPQLIALHPHNSFKKIVAWLEGQTKVQRAENASRLSLTELLWGSCH